MTDRGDMEVGRLWSRYTNFLYMPRLAGFEVLARAVGDGVASLTWAEDTFAYAEARRGDEWAGISTVQMVTPIRSGLLLRPDVVPAPRDEPGPAPGPAGGRPSRGEPEPRGGDTPSSDDDEGRTQSAGRRRFFYACFDLDPVRGISQLQRIMREISNHLGEGVKLTLEIEAEAGEGFDQHIRRVVSENATNLGAAQAEFE